MGEEEKKAKSKLTSPGEEGPASVSVAGLLPLSSSLSKVNSELSGRGISQVESREMRQVFA